MKGAGWRLENWAVNNTVWGDDIYIAYGNVYGRPNRFNDGEMITTNQIIDIWEEAGELYIMTQSMSVYKLHGQPRESQGEQHPALPLPLEELQALIRVHGI